MSWGLRPEDNCRYCGRPAEDAHHIVPRRMSGRGVDDELRNLMPLCRRCHRGHHERTQPIPRSLLSPVEEAFAMGAAGAEWLAIWYPKGDK